MERFKSFLILIRPINSVILGLAILIGVVISGGLGLTPVFLIFLSFLTGFSLTASAMAINDYYDKEIDLINEPTRPIPSGLVKPVEALFVTALLSLIGLVSAWMTSTLNLLLAAFSWFLMFAYSAWGKKRGFLGNMMVSTCIALPFIYGGVIASNLGKPLIFAIMAFLSNTGREITKGIVDVEGDQKQGVKTIAVTKGAVTASRVAVVFYLASIFISTVPVLLNLVSNWYLLFVLITDVGLLFSSYHLIGNPSRDVARVVKNQVLYWMISGLLAFGFGSL